ncbi:MAG: hypothetical protein E7035_02095 [Verrucomicrobiaceae bacterium]|nr:hypothetical protein [Verrucomicrobiaceae bacterium]
MKKLLLIASLIASMFIMSACDSMEGPSPIDTAAVGGDASALGNDELSDANLADGLQQRGLNESGAGFDPENINPEDIVATVYFTFNQYAIPASERENVKKAAEYFKANPDKVCLVGHTDWYGTEEYNMLLSDKRCKAVQEYMLGLGVDAGKVETIARGEQGSVVDVAKNSAEAKNDRRVDIVKIK